MSFRVSTPSMAAAVQQGSTSASNLRAVDSCIRTARPLTFLPVAAVRSAA